MNDENKLKILVEAAKAVLKAEEAGEPYEVQEKIFKDTIKKVKDDSGEL